MTKDIILTISGLSETEGIGDEPMEVLTPGVYYLKNGKHYVQFSEMLEGFEGELKSTLKFNESGAELIRSGPAATRMRFVKDEATLTMYRTPMGAMPFQIYTEELQLKVTEESIDLGIIYSISMDGQVITENQVKLNVCPKELKRLE